MYYISMLTILVSFVFIYFLATKLVVTLLTSCFNLRDPYLSYHEIYSSSSRYTRYLVGTGSPARSHLANQLLIWLIGVD